MSTPVLEIIDLKKTYKRGFRAKPVYALKGVSFKIEPGVITGFLGANGAGKTTTIKCLLELSLADSGRILYFGKEGLSNEAKSKIGFLPERPYFYDYLTGREFLRFYGKISNRLKSQELEQRVNDLLKRVGLAHAGDRQLRSYSKGMLQRVGIAQALIHRPEFIILDEPQTGLDPDGRFEVREIIRETASEGTAVFFSSHLLPDAEQLCDDLVIYKQGEMIYNGSTQKLLGQAESGFRITTSENGKLHEHDVKTAAELQQKIDALRAQRLEIREVRPLRLSLEEIFIKMGFDAKSPIAAIDTEGARR
jgi:ABC-2 type transport system ATP-binding protein